MSKQPKTSSPFSSETRQRCLFKHIGHRVLLLVGTAVLLGLFGMLKFFTDQQEQTIMAQNERTMRLLTRSVSHGLQTVMLAGYADIARDYSENLKNIEGISEFRILRLDGNEAFQDNKTIRSVNKRLGEEEFMERETETEMRVISQDDPNWRKALGVESELAVYDNQAKGSRSLTFLVPIRNQKPCFRCHGGDHPVRGLLKLTTSLSQAENDIQITKNKAYQVMAAAVGGILLLLYLVIRGTVVKPLGRITQAMIVVAGGDLRQKVPILGCDELGRMAESFNKMSHELLKTYTGLRNEQDKLTTIILSAREGIVVTDRSGSVVLVNPATERHLGKTREEIVSQGFMSIIDDPDFISAFLERSGINMPDTVIYNSKVLNIYASTIQNTEGEAIGSAALIRDVTEEKKLEEQLRRLSTTDGLTGLFNRRRFDEALREEFGRSKRYAQPLTLLLFDVDHFKKFNDTYGHAQGDRVLQAIGRLMKGVFRDIDYPCRYGGEEFCVILPNTGHVGGILAAERLRATIEAEIIDGLKVTISIGVSIIPNESPENPDAMLKLADNAVYESKRGGRNRVTYLGPESIRK